MCPQIASGGTWESRSGCPAPLNDEGLTILDLIDGLQATAVVVTRGLATDLEHCLGGRSLRPMGWGSIIWGG